eukprot:gnl/Hemi2/12756_TR4359_c0_g3_i1.p1 gnl/Hemi2/12756_TR4359_c0_g3~~gnl/Hemi2/12756_TR4359_c0_g3_i1.p1  ORF type:complete len:116 (-),score=18.01 gnl/Hemi2/12756_TR4359_c0_g3_i1:296-643(-)
MEHAMAATGARVVRGHIGGPALRQHVASAPPAVPWSLAASAAWSAARAPPSTPTAAAQPPGGRTRALSTAAVRCEPEARGYGGCVAGRAAGIQRHDCDRLFAALQACMRANASLK